MKPSGEYSIHERTSVVLMLGRMLFRFGASTQRVIDSMEVLHSHLGGGKLEVLVAYDAITVTATEGTQTCTFVDAAREVAGVNIRAQGEIRRMLLSEDAATWDLPRFRERLLEIGAVSPLLPPMPWHWVAAGVASAAFCAFNGGDWSAIAIAVAAALVIFTVRRELLRRKFSIYPATLGAVCVGGVGAALAARAGWSGTPDIALIAPVLFLVPGVPMILGGIDITRNHNSIGLARIAYTLVLTATLIFGLALSLPLITHAPLPAHPPHVVHWYQPFIGAGWGALAGASLALLNGGYWRAIGVCALCGALARLVKEGGGILGADAATSTLLAAIAATVLAILLSTRRRMPSVILAVMGCLTLIPGFYAITGARVLFQISVLGGDMPWPEAAMGLRMLLQALFISFAIIAGIILTFMTVERGTRRV